MAKAPMALDCVAIQVQSVSLAVRD